MAAQHCIPDLPEILHRLHTAAAVLRGSSAGAFQFAGTCPHLNGLVSAADMVADDLARLADQLDRASIKAA